MTVCPDIWSHSSDKAVATLSVAKRPGRAGISTTAWGQKGGNRNKTYTHLEKVLVS